MTTSSHSIPQPSPSPPDAPQGFQPEERDAAFNVLAEAITSLSQASNSPVTGSAVRLEMARRTYGGFDPKRVGYKRFRDFLDDAENRGYVEVDRERPGDVAVTIPGVPREVDSTPMMRSDLWKAFSDWNPRTSRFYDINEERVVTLPTEPAPLEPPLYAELREKISQSPAEFVEIKPVSRQQQLDWMQEFALLVGDPEVSRVLSEALKSTHPARYFVVVLRNFPNLLSKWHNLLRGRVYAEALKWQNSDARLTGVQIERVESTEKPSASPTREGNSAPADSSGRRTRDDAQKQGRDRDAIQFFTTQRVEKTIHSGSTLRERLHHAIEQMPESELRKISIPVGYLFEE